MVHLWLIELTDPPYGDHLPDLQTPQKAQTTVCPLCDSPTTTVPDSSPTPVAVLSNGSFYAFTFPTRYVSNALVTQTQPHERSHIAASVLIRFINIMQPHKTAYEREHIKGVELGGDSFYALAFQVALRQ